MYYAELDGDGNILGIQESPEELIGNYIQIPDFSPGYLGKRWNGSGFEPKPPRYRQEKVISRSAFINRLTESEWYDVKEFAKGTTVNAKKMAQFLDMITYDDNVDLDGPGVQGLLGVMVAAGIITGQRLGQIAAKNQIEVPWPT